MEKKYDLLSKVLNALQAAGVLNELVIAGSWCQYYYRILFDEAPEIPLIRTTDIDFLIPSPQKIKKKLDVAMRVTLTWFFRSSLNTALQKKSAPSSNSFLPS